MGGWVGEWMCGRVDVWTGGCTGGRAGVVVYVHSSPMGLFMIGKHTHSLVKHFSSKKIVLFLRYLSLGKKVKRYTIFCLRVPPP